MSVEDILREIEQKGKIQLEIIRKETDEKISKIIGEAKENARKILEDGRASFERQLEYERKRIVSTVNMEMKMLYNRTLNEIIDEYVRKILDLLPSLRNSDHYREYIMKSIEKGRNEIGNNYVIIISEKDSALVNSEKNVRFSKSLEPLGGVIIESLDGKKRADYSLVNVVNERILQIKQEIYEKMKGEM